MKKINITQIIMAASALLMLIGINTWFQTCGPMEDGSYMACHWAGQAVKGASAVLLVLSVAHVVMKDLHSKTALDLSIGVLGLMTALVPGTLINLCGMDTMMCRAHTQPWVIGLSAVIILAAAFDAFFCRSAADAEKHKRQQAQ